MKESIIKSIVEKRKELGISKLEMSKKLGVSYYGYIRLEDGFNVGIDTYVKALETLGLNIKIVNKK